ncbi:RIP metalloprotease RseP [Chitinasiproducens palmae]|uniref:Zinc metalloprotease n=1 Tax=Chitinasiproducens palmae TaxID=1770053 RepID=A0A1H2PM17_9BURK|nr:RIP metalloprotease RseP [Chitinasiproducens palmae]SDV47471.1 site-2 protease. Metallo peptidase. MEROPS family M50B [Chitinasiproducens palmae]
MSLLIAVAAFAVAIGILVVAHEFGHYSVARLCGVRVLRFSLGLGKPFYSWRDRSGTEWTLGSLPFGGYVKMLDERDETGPLSPQARARAFNRQSVGRRFAIVAAGPAASFLLAIVLFSGLYMAGVNDVAPVLAQPDAATPAAAAGLRAGDQIVAAGAGAEREAVRGWSDLRWRLIADGQGAGDGARAPLVLDLEVRRDGAVLTRQLRLAATDAGKDAPAPDDPAADPLRALGLAPLPLAVEIGEIRPGSPAAAGGLRAGDRLLAVQGQAVTDASRFVAAVRAADSRALALDVLRDGKTVRLSVTPHANADGVVQIGAGIGERLRQVKVSYGPVRALALGAQRTLDVAVFSVKIFWRMLTGQASLKNLSGPVTIADQAGQSARIGLAAFISFIALVSISIGVLNLLPIPVLDGGHLLYYAVEAVTGRAVSERVQGLLQRFGLLCIIALSAIALFNDLTRVFRS